MKPRTTLIIAAIFLLLGGYIYFFELNKTPEQLSQQLGTPTATPQRYAILLDASQVKSVEIADLRGPRLVKLTRTDTGWQVNQPIDKVADRFEVESAVGALTSLKATRVLTNVTDLGQYGFITPTLEVRLIMSDTKQYALTLGNKTPNGLAYYAVYTGDKSQIFLIDSSGIETVRNWLDTPPYEPTPTPTFTPTATPSVTDTPAATSTPSATETPKP